MYNIICVGGPAHLEYASTEFLYLNSTIKFSMPGPEWPSNGRLYQYPEIMEYCYRLDQFRMNIILPYIGLDNYDVLSLKFYAYIWDMSNDSILDYKEYIYECSYFEFEFDRMGYMVRTAPYDENTLSIIERVVNDPRVYNYLSVLEVENLILFIDNTRNTYINTDNIYKYFKKSLKSKNIMKLDDSLFEI